MISGKCMENNVCQDITQLRLIYLGGTIPSNVPYLIIGGLVAISDDSWSTNN